MTPRFVGPLAAAQIVAAKLGKEWAEAVCGDLGLSAPFDVTVRLRPGVQHRAAIHAADFGQWQVWAEAWRGSGVDAISGATVEHEPLELESAPVQLRVVGLDAGLALVTALGVPLPARDFDHARRIAAALAEAGAVVSPSNLRATLRLRQVDADVAVTAVRWLRDHPDVADWTVRQIPVPGMHSKWVESHGSVLSRLLGRDVREQTRPRLAVTHLTYVDPEYLTSGARRHDAWTTGDVHELAYRPSTVVVVENRDCRLWFPPAPGTVVVEGEGDAAVRLVADIPWVRRADRVVYWGDIDADGFTILDRFRDVMRRPGPGGEPAHDVRSILMDLLTLERRRALGVDYDKNGRPLGPSRTPLECLDAHERQAYHSIASAGQVEVRRVEQERLAAREVSSALADLVARTVTTRC